MTKSPTTTGPEALVRSFYEIVTSGDEARLNALLAPDWEMVPTAYPGQPRGPGGYAPLMKGFNVAFPDGRFEILEVIAAHPKYTVRTKVQARHAGPFLGRAATGKTITFDTIDIHEVEGDRIVRSWHIEDFAGLFGQIDA